MDLLILTPLAAVIALIADYILAKGVLNALTGDSTMNERYCGCYSGGTGAYMNRQYRTITYVALAIITVLQLFHLRRKDGTQQPGGEQPLALPWETFFRH